MSAWLLSIVGVTVIGVLIELLLTDSPMSKFVRSIYAFFILFIIVQPLPGFFRSASNSVNGGVLLDQGLIENINSQTRAAFERSAEIALAAAGFADCIVTFVGEKIYVNAFASTKKDKNEIISIVTAICNVKPDAVEVFL